MVIAESTQAALTKVVFLHTTRIGLLTQEHMIITQTVGINALRLTVFGMAEASWRPVRVSLVE
jgi:hypothetical protein